VVKKLRWKRNSDLDPQLVWRGKDFEADPLEVDAPPIYIQEKIQPRAIIEDLRKQTKERQKDGAPQFDFFHDFNGLPEGWKEDATASYYHDEGNWQNRMILGDSLLVMGSLAEREGLRGKVQCIYMDPPYGIKFNSNWQPSTKSRDVRDGNQKSLSREPEVIRAFRDTWSDGIHSYLPYLRDRLVAAKASVTRFRECLSSNWRGKFACGPKPVGRNFLAKQRCCYNHFSEDWRSNLRISSGCL
jgi:adenine-specific DNA-methyltransferase